VVIGIDMDQCNRVRARNTATQCLIQINAPNARACEEIVRVLIGGTRDMTVKIDGVELAHELAEIASTTSDPNTGRQLMEIVERIMRAAGLPPGTG
jgi:hypothetical protein